METNGTNLLRVSPMLTAPDPRPVDPLNLWIMTAKKMNEYLDKCARKAEKRRRHDSD